MGNIAGIETHREFGDVETIRLARYRPAGVAARDRTEIASRLRRFAANVSIEAQRIFVLSLLLVEASRYGGDMVSFPTLVESVDTEGNRTNPKSERQPPMRGIAVRRWLSGRIVSVVIAS